MWLTPAKTFKADVVPWLVLPGNLDWEKLTPVEPIVFGPNDVLRLTDAVPLFDRVCAIGPLVAFAVVVEYVTFAEMLVKPERR